MNKKRLLFICTANMQRSPTAEHLFDDSEKYEAKSAGIDPFSTTRLTRQALDWADVVIVMEQMHKDYICSRFHVDKEIIVLDIPDVYYFNDPRLIKLLNKKLKNHNIIP